MNKKRINPDNITFVKYRRGKYGAYGDRDLKTYQCKLPREPFEKFDEQRKVYHMCKNEILLGFVEYYNRVIVLERQDLANNKHFARNGEHYLEFQEYKKKQYQKYIEPLVTNGITTDLENGRSISMEEMILDKIFTEVK